MNKVPTKITAIMMQPIPTKKNIIICKIEHKHPIFKKKNKNKKVARLNQKK